jgi:hypothetical protein
MKRTSQRSLRRASLTELVIGHQRADLVGLGDLENTHIGRTQVAYTRLGRGAWS